MALTDTDRRRFVAATALTLLALPALWWANTSENSSAPNLAVAGLDATGSGAGANAPTPVEATETEDIEDADVAPVFLEGPSSAAGAGQSEIAVPAKPLIDGVAAKATFRSNVSNSTCVVAGLASGTRITVVNLDNNRSVTCTSVVSPGNLPGDVVMGTSAFASIADLTDAPISVEIRR